MTTPTTRITTPDRRALTVYDTGDPAGAPLIFHHGTPGSGLPYPPHVELAKEQGVRMISFDRAGYAGSSRRPGRSVGDVADDVEAIADALGLERFATWGLSGGGPHALACAARLGDRVAAAATVAGIAPDDASGLDLLAGMGEANVREYTAAREGEHALRPLLEAEAAELREATVEDVVAVLRSVLSEVDVATLTNELGGHLVRSFGIALSAGVDGWVDDDLAFVAPWGFELGEIAVPVLVVQGGQDLMVPPAHGAWLAANVPGAEAPLQDEAGHITQFRTESVRELRAWLLARL